MHPAFSIIFFTTSSGTGYGMLFLLGLLGLRGELPDSLLFLITSFACAFLLITAGLLSSTLHLGNPQRAWRALSQWRTSWLSREGVMAIITYPVAGAFALALLWGTIDPIWLMVLASFTSLCAALTVITTANIYASLKTIAQWNHVLVTPSYLLLALSGGSSVLFGLLVVFGELPESILITTTVSLISVIVIKRLYWRDIDRMKSLSSPETATGLGHLGRVRSLEHPHSQANWVMREMGFNIGREHAKSLRMISLICFMATLACTMLAGIGLPGATSSVFALASILLLMVALLTERWLLFAEAKHVVTHYYT